ncbi:MAG TPA: immunoglobulin domain-containing protein, partial [Verrucomicrobiota bacterium]|nr:immunoglobulin domain-containing protein [Verrucomicrobiota bacterium]
QTTAALSLSNVQAAQAGSYTVVVTNAAGSVTSQVATLTVLVPPAIVSQPQSRTNVVGSTATFSVVASGTEPLAYQWCFNGTNLVTGGRIGGATSSTLAISSVETNDAGTYSVLVSNVCSTVASAEAVLTVSASPGMEGSVYVTTYVGSVLTTCAPVCYDPLGLGCTVSTYGSTAISGAPGVPSRTKCTYGWAGTVNWSVLPILDPANAGGVYRIEVAHTATSSTTKDATVTAWSDYGTVSASCTNSPVFQQSYGGDVWQTMGYITNQPGTSDPLIYFIVTGGTVNNSGNRLYIDAFKFTHVDSCDGVVGDLIVTGPLAAGNMYVPVTGVTAGATNVTVYANDVEIGQTNYAAGFAAGALDVPVNSALVQGNIIKATQSKTNAIGGVCTSAMPTDGPPVLEPPAIVSQPQSRTNVVGSTATFSVVASGTEPLAYQWCFNGTNLAGQTTAALSLSNVQTAQAGSYTVVVTNAAGSVTSAAAVLTVLEPPAIVSQPQSRTNVVGSTATFSVVASGTEPLAYQWCFNGTNLADQTTTALSLSNVQAAQAGSYTVVVTNAAGSVTSAAAVLTVLEPPAIVSQPQSRTNVVGSTATFSVVASGTEPLAYQWCFNGTNLAGQTSTTLTLGSVQTAQAGSYTVVVTNAAGSVTSQVAALTVLVPTRIISLSGDLAFGDVLVGSSSNRVLTITNAGNSALRVTNITYSPPGVFGGDWAGSIPAGGSTNVTVTFSPTAATSYSGTVRVNSDATGGVDTMSSSGSGVPCDLVVVNTSDSGAGSLRQAILNANICGGGIVVFSNVSGAITLTSGELVISRNVNIIGPGATNLAVSGNNAVRVFNISSNAICGVSGLTIANGAATWPSHGGAIYNAGFLTLSDCTISDSHTSSGFGGGIYNAGVLVLNGSTLTGNRASGGDGGRGAGGGGGGAGLGGAIYSMGPNVAMTNCTFSRNEAVGGNGGWTSGGNNTFGGYGGGPTGGNGGGLCEPGQNGGYGSGGGGGGGWWETPYETICLGKSGGNGGFGGGGGGAGDYIGGAVGGTGGDFGGDANNQDGGGGAGLGGGFFVESGDVTIVNCTFTQNGVTAGAGAQSLGGAIFRMGGIVRLLNSLITGQAGGWGTCDVVGGVYSLGHNLVSDAFCFDEGDCDLVFVDASAYLGELQYSGGATPTHPLLCNSPAIDAGTTTGAPGFDQRGVPRPQGTAVDIGAFEFVHLPPTIAASPQDQTVSVGDTATFTVTASGTPPLFYQWRFNGTDLAGQTTTALSLSNVQTTQAGSYTVVVTNAAGSVTSAAGVLTVVLPPAPVSGSVVAWGGNAKGQSSVPPGLTDVVAVAGGIDHSLALKTDGTVVGWGLNSYGQTNPPAGLSNVVAVAAGWDTSFALKRDGTLEEWGWDGDYGLKATAEALTNIIAVSALWDCGMVLKSDNTVFVWGKSRYGETNVPAGLADVVAISGGGQFCMAKKRDGTVVVWGGNYTGQTNVPAGLNSVAAVAAGSYHCLALRSNGTVVAWGDNAYGQTNVPPDLTNAVAVSAGGSHSLALRADGTLAVWGRGDLGQTNIPPCLHSVFAISSGGGHNLALVPGFYPMRFSGVDYLPNGQARLTVDGLAGDVYRVLGSSNLLDWLAIGTVTNASGTVTFTDASAPNFNRRFYRLVTP